LTLTYTPTRTSTPTFTPTSTPTETPIPTSTIDPIALNFGDPILEAIQGHEPIFEDDFSSDKGWNAGDPDQYLPLSLDGGFIQAIRDGGRQYTHITHPDLGEGLQDFVVMVDAAFMESPTRPTDRAICLAWWPGDNLGEGFLLYRSGVYEGITCTPTGPCHTFVTGRIEPIATEQFVSLILIHRKGESVVYVNRVPVAYHLLSISDFHNGFSLCPHTFNSLQSNIKYDNVQVWNLDRIPGLP
jgi:hypothetical protein